MRSWALVLQQLQQFHVAVFSAALPEEVRTALVVDPADLEQQLPHAGDVPLQRISLAPSSRGKPAPPSVYTVVDWGS